MYSETIINEDLTLATFGYNSYDLEEKSTKKIVVECKNCKKIIHKEKRNSKSKHRCPTVIGNNKRCFKCKKWKDLTLFNKNPKTSGGVSKICRECYNSYDSVKKCESRRKNREKTAIKNNDIEFYIKRRFYKKRQEAKNKNIEFDIEYIDLISLWKDQNGLCFYTNLPMINSLNQKGFQSWDAPSLDRLDPKKGYVKGNIVWCIFAVNSFKQSLNLEEFQDQLKKIKWNYK